MPDDELIRAFDALWAASEKRSWIYGRLGKVNTDGTVALQTGRAGYLYVRVGPEGNTATSVARNVGAPIKAHLPVRMRLEDGELVIHGVDYGGLLDAFGNGTDSGYAVAKHTHAIGSGMEYPIEGMRLAPGRVQWSTALTVTIFPFRYYWNGAWETWEGGTIDLTSYKPASGKWAWVVVGVNPATNTAVAAKGADQNGRAALTVGLIDAVSFGSYIPCAAVQLAESDTVVNDISRWWDAHGWLNGGPHVLDDHTDVVITSVADNHVLAYDSGTSKWINQAAAALGIVLDDLADVIITTPADNDLLAFDSGSSKWINQTAAGAGLAATGHSHALDDLSDVTATSPAAGQIIRYTGAAWVNGRGNRPNLGARQDVTISGGIADISGYLNVGYFNVRGQGGAADDLDTLNGGAEGDVVVLTGANEAITVKDVTGNINMVSDRALASAADILVLFYTGSDWLEVSYSNL